MRDYTRSDHRFVERVLAALDAGEPIPAPESGQWTPRDLDNLAVAVLGLLNTIDRDVDPEHHEAVRPAIRKVTLGLRRAATPAGSGLRQ